MPQSRSGRTKARSGAKQVAQDGEAEKKKTFIVKVPAKTSEVTSSVFDSEPSLATAGERAADSDFTQTIILQKEEDGRVGIVSGNKSSCPGSLPKYILPVN